MKICAYSHITIKQAAVFDYWYEVTFIFYSDSESYCFYIEIEKVFFSVQFTSV